MLDGIAAEKIRKKLAIENGKRKNDAAMAKKGNLVCRTKCHTRERRLSQMPWTAERRPRKAGQNADVNADKDANKRRAPRATAGLDALNC